MKQIFLIFLLLVLAIFVFVFFKTADKANNSATAVINGRYFNAEIAKTEKQKEVGLAKYNNIKDDFMMVFSFEKAGYYGFWMKDMKFSIDIIFVRQNKIVEIFKNVPYPKSDLEKLAIYKPEFPADTVLEINAGLSDKYNFKKGDGVKIKN